MAGNEGLGEVTELGDGVEKVREGDWIVMIRPQSGTWQTQQNVLEDHVLRVPRKKGTLTAVHGATLTVCARLFGDVHMLEWKLSQLRLGCRR